MALTHILRELVKTYGPDPQFFTYYKKGISAYNRDFDRIKLYLDPSQSYADHVFTLLHEYRHAIQVHSKLFPDMLDREVCLQVMAQIPYIELPWERDANEWAWYTGIEMGFWDNKWKPVYLWGYPVGDLR